MSTSPPLLEAEALQKSFPLAGDRRLLAVDGVDLRVDRGETLAIVGESGCGKSTLGRIALDGVNTAALHRRDLRAMRRRIQVIFQDPFSSLEPRQRIRDVLTRPMLLHGLANRATAAAGLPP